MSIPTVIGFYGSSDSGKTTLITKLTKQLVKKGYRVAAIKKTPKTIPLDVEGKDTWRYRDAGARVIAFSSSKETHIMIDESMDEKHLLATLSMIDFFDIVFIEGAKDASIPKIQCGGRKKRDHTIATYDDNNGDILKVIQKRMRDNQRGTMVKIMVNGKDVPLTEFPSAIIENTMVGMLRSLKGVGKIQDVTILMHRKK